MASSLIFTGRFLYKISYPILWWNVALLSSFYKHCQPCPKGPRLLPSLLLEKLCVLKRIVPILTSWQPLFRIIPLYSGMLWRALSPWKRPITENKAGVSCWNLADRRAVAIVKVLTGLLVTFELWCQQICHLLVLCILWIPKTHRKAYPVLVLGAQYVAKENIFN